MTEGHKVQQFREELCGEYLAAAVSWSATEQARNTRAANSAATKLVRLGKALRNHVEGQACLLDCATHEDPYVRIWAASECLAFNPDFASNVLDKIGQSTGLLALSARTTLSEWKKGNLFLEPE